MILVRDVFQVEFGKARDAVAAWKEGRALFEKLGLNSRSMRLLTDLVGPSYYTLVFERTFESLTEYERNTGDHMKNEQWKEWYAKVAPFMAGGHREILNIVE